MRRCFPFALLICVLFLATLSSADVLKIVVDDTIQAATAERIERALDHAAAIKADAVLIEPRNVVVDAGGNLIIADSGNSRVRRFDAGSNTVTTIVGNGALGSPQDNVPALNSALNVPSVWPSTRRGTSTSSTRGAIP